MEPQFSFGRNFFGTRYDFFSVPREEKFIYLKNDKVVQTVPDYVVRKSSRAWRLLFKNNVKIRLTWREWFVLLLFSKGREWLWIWQVCTLGILYSLVATLPYSSVFGYTPLVILFYRGEFQVYYLFWLVYSALMSNVFRALISALPIPREESYINVTRFPRPRYVSGENVLAYYTARYVIETNYVIQKCSVSLPRLLAR